MLKTRKKLNAVIALEVILTMTLYYFILLGETFVSYAIDVVKTNNTNVEFNAYFLDSNGEKIERLEENIDQEACLYVDVSVKNEGYFNGTITLNNNNFNIKPENLSSQIAEISGNEVKLNQINAGSTATIKLGIEAKKEDTIQEATLDTKTEVNLSGQYVNSKNVEKDGYLEIEGTAEVQIAWKSSEETNAELEASVLTNSIYEENGEEKRIVQILVNSKITKNNYPIKNTEVTLNVPENVKDIKVHTRSTKATNSNLNFGEENYTYDELNKKLIIQLSNEDGNNISWNKNVQDTLIVTYVLNKEESITGQEIQVNSKIQTYDAKELTANQNLLIEKEIDGIITNTIENTEESIYKGKLYTGEERDYTLIHKINIDYLNVINNITIKGEETTYIAGEQEGAANIVYKETKIDKQEFLKIFGEEGSITITDGAGTTIGNINKDSEADENGKIVIRYATPTKKIEMTTSKPVEIGTFNIENTKAILDAGYAEDVVASLTGIKEKVIVNEKEVVKSINLQETQAVANLEVETEKILTWKGVQNLNLKINLDTKDESKKLYKSPQFIITLPSELTNIELHQVSMVYGNGLNIENYELTQKEDGQYQIMITTSGEQENYNQAENAEIYIYTTVDIGILTPTQTKPIELYVMNEEAIELLHTNANLSIESTNGLMLYNKVINFNDANEELVTYEETTQTGILDRKSNRDHIVMGSALVNNYDVAIQNVVILGKIPANTNENNTYATSLSDITVNADAMIYYSTDPNAQAEDSTWTEDKTNAVAYKIVMNTINAKQVVKIALKINIPQNLNYNEQGEFTTKVTYQCQDMQLQKVNHIILKTETSVMALKTNAEGITQDLANGLKANIIAITGNRELKDGESTYEGQTIKYYITLTNETNEDLSHVKVTASQVNGKVWKMVDIEALNPGTQENQIEKHYKQTQDSDIEFDTIENIPRGESITLTYEAYANDLEENDEITTYGTIHISGEDPSIQEELKTQEAIIKDAQWSLAITEGRRQDADLYDGDILKLNINLINKNDTPKSDVTIKIIYSSKLKYSENSIYLNTDYLDEETGEMVSRASIENVEVNDNGETIITLKISDIEANETMDISMFADIPVFYSMEEEVNVRAFIEQTESEQYVSNELTRKITGRTKNISLEEKSFMDETEIDADTIVKHGTTISMEYTISNNDTRDANIEITKSLLEGLDNISVAKKKNEETIDLTDYISDGIFVYKDVLEANTEEKIIFTGTVDLTYVLEDTLEYELSVQDTDTGSTYSKNVLFTTNKSEIADEEETDDPEATEPDIDDNEKWEIPEEGQDDDGNDGNDDDNDNDDGNDDDNDGGNEDDGNDDDQNTGNGQDDNGNQDDTNQDIKNYTISGIAWIDSDADGKRSSSETVLENVSIMAMNAATGQLMTQTTKTDSEGKYSLTLPEEKYILLFLYDETEYYVTTYQAKGIDETVNSDAISKNVTIDGVDKTVGATDEINLQSDRSNIDIGLIYRAKFDLKVEKYISKVTVSNEEGTETTEYNNTSLAKTEIASKYLKGSLVVVEYTIKITNIGEIAGYIGEIIDEAPSSLEFKSNMNSNWFLNDGKLYNMSLENKKLDVNESSEVKLILTKTMTESNTGLVNNTAYIQNSYNERGINDLDAGNDKNSANLMISVKTGVVFKFLSLTLVIIIIEFGVVFIITKKVLLK